MTKPSDLKRAALKNEAEIRKKNPFFFSGRPLAEPSSYLQQMFLIRKHTTIGTVA